MSPPAGILTSFPPMFARKVSGIGIKCSRLPLNSVDKPLGELGSGSTCSLKVSVTSTRLLVDPQAIHRLYPWITPGAPGRVLPNTGSSLSSRPIGKKIDGRPSGRCGSFAISGRPFSVSAPDTAQRFEPPRAFPSRMPRKIGMSRTRSRYSRISLTEESLCRSVRARSMPRCSLSRLGRSAVATAASGTVAFGSNPAERHKSSENSLTPSNPKAAPA